MSDHVLTTVISTISAQDVFVTLGLFVLFYFTLILVRAAQQLAHKSSKVKRDEAIDHGPDPWAEDQVKLLSPEVPAAVELSIEAPQVSRSKGPSNFVVITVFALLIAALAATFLADEFVLRKMQMGLKQKKSCLDRLLRR